MRGQRPRASLLPARAFARSTEGSAAAGFALVAVPFLTIIGAVFQFAYIIWAAHNLEHTLEQAVRGLMTGSFQNANHANKDPKAVLANLKTAMCGSDAAKIATLFKCGDVKLSVAVSGTFANGSSASAYDPSTKAISTNFEGYACAKPGEIVIVTAAVSMPTFFGTLVPGSWTLGDGSYLLQSRSVFRTEPYQPTSATGC